jgi:hypothetical protein
MLPLGWQPIYVPQNSLCRGVVNGKDYFGLTFFIYKNNDLTGGLTPTVRGKKKQLVKLCFQDACFEIAM